MTRLIFVTMTERSARRPTLVSFFFERIRYFYWCDYTIVTEPECVFGHGIGNTFHDEVFPAERLLMSIPMFSRSWYYLAWAKCQRKYWPKLSRTNHRGHRHTVSSSNVDAGVEIEFWWWSKGKAELRKSLLNERERSTRVVSPWWKRQVTTAAGD